MMDSHKRLGIAEFAWGQSFAKSSHHRVRLGMMLRAAVALALFLVFVFAKTASAQSGTDQLTIFKNYFVTGDYVIGGVGLRGTGNTTTNLATGTIRIPDQVQPNATGVPAGADIVAAFLYWETVEKDKQTLQGQTGFFNGYPIKGVILGPNSPPSFNNGGCTGSSLGATVIRAYRADVRPFLPVDAFGNIRTPNATTPGSYQVVLADSGSNGGGTPLTMGATLVIIYKVLSAPLAAVPLNSIVMYDGAFAPSNQTTGSVMTQTIKGFYQAAVTTTRNSKLTHIVGSGSANKGESVSLNNVALPNLYPALSTTAAFPGAYNGSWDNATWSFSGGNNPVGSGDSSAITMVTPAPSGGGCPDWGAVIFSTTVEDPNHDGLLAVWKTANPPGYTDVISTQDGLSNPFVDLQRASSAAQDIFVEIDYLALRDPITNAVLHSHLPKQLALDKAGDAYWKQNVHVHFDVGKNFNAVCKLTPALPGQGTGCLDPYIIQGGTGGNEIPESAVVCTDSTTLCQFPNQAAVGWKEGLLFVKNNATVPNSSPAVPLGNFQFGRKDSYHYVLFGHALGTPRSFWTTFGATEQSASVAKLMSIVVSTVNSVTTATVTIQSPAGLLKPGDCPNASIPACNDTNVDRVTVAGAMGQATLNNTYKFTNASSSAPDANNVIATTFNITTSRVPDGTYNYSNEARLAVEYAGPTSSSGHSDFRGGGDTAVTFGLWRVDDAPGCQADPSVAAPPSTYCVDQVGTITAEAGTLLHEMGHTLTLTHGGQFFANGLVNSGPLAGQEVNNPPFSPPTYGLNCNPAFLSSMNYLHQIRGFPDGPLPDGTFPIDYSGQTLPNLSEIALSESVGMGVGSDPFTGLSAAHLPRWYAPPNALDQQIGRLASHHCDGSLVGPNEPPAVRVDGTLSSLQGSTFSAPLDWNNNLIVPDALEPVAWQDVDFNGSTSSVPDPPFQGFNDWLNVDLRQVGSRASAFGLSGGGSQFDLPGGGSQFDLPGGGSQFDLPGGGSQFDLPGGGSPGEANSGGATFDLPGGGSQFDLPGGGSQFDLPGGGSPGEANSGGATFDLPGGGSQFDLPGGGSQFDLPGGGAEQDQNTACSTADPPVSLNAALGSKSVVLNWTAPGPPCQVRRYDIWRAQGSFPTLASVNAAVTANPKLFTNIGHNVPPPTPPSTTFTDFNVKNNVMYTYFVTETNAQGVTSRPTDPPAVIMVSFNP